MPFPVTAMLGASPSIAVEVGRGPFLSAPSLPIVIRSAPNPPPGKFVGGISVAWIIWSSPLACTASTHATCMVPSWSMLMSA